MRTCRIYPRMEMGGVENAVLQYLRASGGDTVMVVTHREGMRAPEARALAADYRFLGDGRPRLPGLLEALRGAEVAHLHVINHDLLGALAAQLAGTPRIVQTQHNHFTPPTEVLVDHTICVGHPVREMLVEPLRSSVIHNGVPAPDTLPPFTPWYETGRPLRILELRRPDKEMAPSLAAVAKAGGLGDLPVELRVAGFSRADGPPGVTYLGPLDDPRPELAAADLVLHASRFDTFGRVAYEALAWGATPVLPRTPVFTTVFEEGEVVFLDVDRTPRAAGARIRAAAAALAADPAGHAARRAAAHARVRDEFSVAAMVRQTEAVVSGLRPAPRSFAPADLSGADLGVLGAVLDQLLYGPGLPDLGRLGTLPGRAAAVAGWAAVASGRLPASPVAVQLLEQVNGILGPRPAVMLTLGQTLAKLDRKAQAATWLLRAAQARPKNTAAWLEAVTLLVDLRKVEQAVRILDKGIAANPGVAALTHARARLGVLLIGA